MITRRVLMKGAAFMSGLGRPTPSRFPYQVRPQSPGVAPGSGSVVRAQQVIIYGPNGGLFFYNGTPALGTLVYSITVAPGLDPIGLNAVLANATSYTNVGGTWHAVSQNLGGTFYYTATSPAGPWSQIGSADYHTLSIPGTPTRIMGITPGLSTPYLTIGVNAIGRSANVTYYPPSGDSSGITDATVINALLAAGYAVQLLPDLYYVNATIQMPGHGILHGAGRDILGNANCTTIQAVGSLQAVIATVGWTANVAAPGVNGTDIAHLTINGAGTAVNGIVLQTQEGRVRDVGVTSMTNNGIAWYAATESGAHVVAGNLSNNRVTDCAVQSCGGRGIATIESGGSDVYTDGWCTDNVIDLCDTGIGFDQAADWQIIGNHIYNSSTDGIYVGDCWNTHIISNQVDQWATTPSAGVYRGINAVSVSSTGGMSVVAGNVLWMGSAPGAISDIEGMNLGCAANQTTAWTVIGNNCWCEAPPASMANANAFIATNAAATSTMNLVSTGNQAMGTWVNPNWVTVPSGGTINHTAGI